jgi:mRNA-degrading endonuclease RelE of RelBE toxin-antitoxin system
MAIRVVLLTLEAQRDVDRLPKVIRARVYRILERLAQWPEVSGAKALTGDLAGRYRLRTGDYRIQFHVEEQAVVVERVGHRDRFYDG